MKKLLTTLICIAIICALCACGERGELPTPPSAAPSAGASNEPAADASESPQASDNPSADASAEPSASPSDEPVVPPAVILQGMERYQRESFGDAVTEFVLKQTKSMHDGVSRITLTEFRRGEYIQVYGHALRLYEYDYCLEPRDVNAEPPFGWRLLAAVGRLYREVTEPRYIVIFEGEDEAAVVGEMTKSQMESWYSLKSYLYGSLETTALMTIYESRIVGTDLEPSPWWQKSMETLETRESFIPVTDADGNDISEEITTLWVRADDLFSEADCSMFISTNDPSGAYDRIFGYDEGVDAVFSARGRAQLQGTSEGFGLPLYRFRDYAVYKREVWHSGMGRFFALEDTEVKSVAADRIEMSIPYDVATGFDENYEPSEYERRWVDFTVVLTEDGWRVEDYPCPHAGVNSYDYDSGDEICVIDPYPSSADELYYRPLNGKLYAENLDWLRDGFGGAEVEAEVRIDDALTYVELWLDDGALGSASFTVDRDDSGEVLESETADWTCSVGLTDEWMIEIAQRLGGMTEQAEGYVEPLISDGDRNIIDTIESMRAYRDHDLEVSDRDGRDISDELVDLWIIGNHIYGGSVFDGIYPQFDWPHYHAEIFNFEEVLGKFYTDKGAAQVREAQYGTSGSFFFERDGSMWMFCPGVVMTYDIPAGIVGASVVEQTDTRIVLDVTYDATRWEELYGKELDTERITFEREDGVWKIADYDPPMVWLPSREATITFADGVEQHELFDWISDEARLESLSLDTALEEYGCHIVEVVAEGVEEAASLATESGGRMVMWRAKFRMKPDTAPTGDLGEYFETDDNGWITTGIDGEVYMIGYESVNGVWHGIGAPSESTIHDIYGDAEHLAEYGDVYTATMSRYYENNYDRQVLNSLRRNEPDAVELQGE